MLKLYLIAVLVAIANLSFSQAMPTVESERGFVENKGQIYDQDNQPNPAVRYLYAMPGLNVQVRNNGFSYDTYTYTEQIIPEEVLPGMLPNKQIGERVEREYSFHRIDIEWVGGNPSPEIIAEQPAADHLNVYNAIVPDGVTGLRHFGKVTYKDIYPGIDLEFIASPSTDKPVEYNFIVHPGANASMIRLKYSGSDKVHLVEGKLVISTASGELTESIPASFLADSKEAVHVSYQKENEIVGFAVAKYDTTQTLIIDPMPTIAWARKYGITTGGEPSNGWTDSSGIYMVSTSNENGTDFIATTGAYQLTELGVNEIFFAKFDLYGVLQWGTFYGGVRNDYGYHITCDVMGNVFVVGESNSLTLASPGAHKTYVNATDAVLLKFDTSGARLWATYFGGPSYESGMNVATDLSGNVFMSGQTLSVSDVAGPNAHQDTMFGFYDVYLVKFSAQGVYQWSTYFGGDGRDTDYELVCDTSGNVFITGVTGSDTRIATQGSFQPQYLNGDAFLAKFSPIGTLVWATYYGGVSGDWAEAMTIDKEQNLIIAGTTQSPFLPGITASYRSSNAGAQDNYFAKFSNDGDFLLGSFYGGPGDEDKADVGTNQAGDILLAGITPSLSGVSSPDALQPAIGGSMDMYFSAFNKAGGFKWASYYGGVQHEKISSINGLGRDVYIVGYSLSNSLPQVGYTGGNGSTRLLKLTDTCRWTIPATVIPADCSNTYEGAIALSPAGGTAPYTYLWSTGEVAASRSNLTGGMYTVSVTDDANCTLDTTITIPAPLPIATTITSTICAGQSVSGYGTAGTFIDTLTASNGCDSVRVINLTVNPYLYYTQDTLLCNGNSLAVGNKVYTTSGTYIDTIATGLCQTIVRSNVSVPAAVRLSFITVPATCANLADGGVFLNPFGGVAPYTYQWSTGDTIALLSSLYGGQYTLTVTDAVGCSKDTTVTIRAPIAITQTISDTICSGQNFEGYGTTGIYRDTFLSANGCDSTRIINLLVQPYLQQVQSVALCFGDSLAVGNNFYTTSGVYVDTVSAGACQAILQSDVTVLPAIFSDSIAGSNIADTVSRYTYTVPYVAGATYYWELGDGFVLSGQGTNSITAQWLPSNGLLWLYTGLDGCTDTLLKKIFIDLDATGISQLLEPAINVYPNPTSNSFSVEIGNLPTGDMVAELLTVTGAKVWNKPILGSTTHFDITNLAQSVYLLQIRHQEFTKIVRVVKY